MEENSLSLALSLFLLLFISSADSRSSHSYVTPSISNLNLRSLLWTMFNALDHLDLRFGFQSFVLSYSIFNYFSAVKLSLHLSLLGHMARTSFSSLLYSIDLFNPSLRFHFNVDRRLQSSTLRFNHSLSQFDLLCLIYMCLLRHSYHADRHPAVRNSRKLSISVWFIEKQQQRRYRSASECDIENFHRSTTSVRTTGRSINWTRRCSVDHACGSNRTPPRAH